VVFRLKKTLNKKRIWRSLTIVLQRNVSACFVEFEGNLRPLNTTVRLTKLLARHTILFEDITL
jgi:hypothetical protein